MKSKEALKFYYAFFRLYENPAWLALFKARALLMSKKVHLHAKYAL